MEVIVSADGEKCKLSPDMMGTRKFEVARAVQLRAQLLKTT